MAKFKLTPDKEGNFYSKGSFKMVPPDFVGRGSDNPKVSLKLLQPSSARIAVLTLTINKQTVNVKVAGGSSVTTGPFPMFAGENLISFEGTSDKPGALHELEVTPQLLT